MIVVMRTGSTEEDVRRIEEHLHERGLNAQLNQGVERTVLGVLGEIYEDLKDELELMQGVGEVFRISKPYKLASREFKSEDSVVHIGKDRVPIGGGHFTVFAGPCAVESEEQTVTTAIAVKKAGANVLRGGAFKPRSSPYSFRGLFEDGLKILKTASEESGLPIITEVMSPSDVELVGRYADVLQIGARNMQNFSLLDEVGLSDIPVMVKRGMSATYEDWILAAEYVMASGNQEVILTERGIRTFETYTRNTLDLNAIPAVRSLSHLPIVADPSHGTGKWHMVKPLAMAAAAVGADGLIIEVHPNPDVAKCDGAQSLTFQNFAELMDSVKAIRATMNGG